MNDLVPPQIQAYAERHTSAEGELLKRINRDTHAHVLRPRMLSGHLQGRLLSMISHMLKPRRILEIGTYTGYSALCLAEGLAPGGTLITLDNNEELETRVRNYFAQSRYNSQIDFRIGNAVTLLTKIDGPFDLVFIDADKENYTAYYDAVFDKLPVGGIIMADNVLWGGKVTEPKPDKDTRAVMAFNERVKDDARVEQVLLPIRDGFTLIRKIV